MSIFDTSLLIILASFFIYGLFFGLIRVVGSLAGILIGALVASKYYQSLFYWLEPWSFGHEQAGKIISFLVLFVIVDRLVRLIFSLLDKTFNLIAIVPFAKSFNRLGGAIIGLIGGVIVLGLAFNFATSYPLIGPWLVSWLEKSETAPAITKATGALVPLIPNLWEKIKSLF